jgi:acyl carrier protein
LRSHGAPGRGRARPYNRPQQQFLPDAIVSTTNGSSAAPTPRTPLESELASLLVQVLNLDVKADEIDPQASLFNEGLGLDSIDVLELALEVSQRYSFQLRADDENNHAIFQSLRTLAAHVAQHRTR